MAGIVHTDPESKALEKALDDAYNEEVAEKARAHKDTAIDTLSDLMAAEISPSVRRQAANDIIELGYKRHSKAEQAAAGRGGFTINIVEFNGDGGKTKEKVVDELVEMVREEKHTA